MEAMAFNINVVANEAYKAADYPTATNIYYAAVKANGKVAKYRTNLCNALLKRGMFAEALQEADAAVAVDSSWPKGYYYKATALEQVGKISEALAACEEGLSIHRHHEALEGLHSRLQTRKQEHEQQQQRLAAGAVEKRTVVYTATVSDDAGHEQAFRFEHKVDSARLARARDDTRQQTLIMQEVVMRHYPQMMLAKPWMCVACQCRSGAQRRATKLLLHPLCYLHLPEPRVCDAGPTPTCSSQECATYSTEMARKMVMEGTRDAQQAAAGSGPGRLLDMRMQA